MPSSLKSGIALALIGSFLFSLKPIFIKQAYALGASSEQLMVLRMWLAFPFYAFMLFLARDALKQHYKYIPVLSLIGFLGYFLSSYLDLIALETISAQAERIILYAYPSLVVLLKSLYEKKLPNRRMVTALFIVYAGILLLLPGELNISGSVTGLILMGICAFTFALYVLTSKPLIERIGTSLFTSGAMLAACLFTQSHLLYIDAQSIFELDSSVYVYALALAFFSTVIPSYTMSAAIARIGSEKTAITGTTGPVFTVLLAVVLLDEPLTLFHVIGLSLVVLGVWILGKK